MSRRSHKPSRTASVTASIIRLLLLTEESRLFNSRVISAVRSTGNKSTELRLITLFRQLRITGWRRNSPLPGKPDFVFPKLKRALFIDGCFWHACPLHGTLPASHRPFWRNKLQRNRARDQHVTRTLRKQGWRVTRIWEHDLTPNRLPALVRRIHRFRSAPIP